MNHLRHSGLPFAEQAAALKAILRADPIVWEALMLSRGLDLPDGMVVSGAIYNSVWNSLTGKPPGHGIKDVDLFYCDGSDLSYEAEDAVIRRATAHFERLPLPVEVRNQARVHLWYPDRFGRACPAYRSSAEALGYFASRTHAVGVRLTPEDALEVVAPFGLDDIFSFRITPNKVMDNRDTHRTKGERAVGLWPQITVEPW
ncbi:nucleotidyltransferase family protein [Mesorhizobium sp. NPDC059054]|uniref:nucleotidyltransferase family protein n=1 Tax=unclassified Mesorhizobium TaxID=325217 RepID=UPI0006C74D80|nr:nucleotidyltransferase family protein [Mesorhizobium sp. 1M-11]